MVAPDDVPALAADAARSVFCHLERAAEHVSDGVRWQTLDGRNQPQYDANVFNGAGGIPLFLADYYRVTGEQRALELACGGATWCAAPERPRSAARRFPTTAG
jgi:hypothetical protein